MKAPMPEFFQTGFPAPYLGIDGQHRQFHRCECVYGNLDAPDFLPGGAAYSYEIGGQPRAASQTFMRDGWAPPQWS